MLSLYYSSRTSLKPSDIDLGNASAAARFSNLFNLFSQPLIILHFGSASRDGVSRYTGLTLNLLLCDMHTLCKGARARGKRGAEPTQEHLWAFHIVILYVRQLAVMLTWCSLRGFGLGRGLLLRRVPLHGMVVPKDRLWYWDNVYEHISLSNEF